jgi:hypothetical protein
VDEIMALVMQAISARAVVLIALLMTIGLFAAAMFVGTVLALVNAGLFGVIVFLPVLLRGSHGKKEHPRPRDSVGVEPEHVESET